LIALFTDSVVSIAALTLVITLALGLGTKLAQALKG
jgi:hypothetical protein